MTNAVDVALREFESVREKIAGHQRTKSQFLALAITATGAIGSFALGRDGNREALLVLPMVLSGLAIVYLRHNVDVELLGQYVRDKLWPAVLTALRAAPSDQEAPGDSSPISIADIPCWDEWIQRRRIEMRRESAYGAMGFIPPLLIFGAPSAGALVLAFAQTKGSTPITFVWGLDIAVLVVSLGLTFWSYTEAPGWKHGRGAVTAGSDQS